MKNRSSRVTVVRIATGVLGLGAVGIIISCATGGVQSSAHAGSATSDHMISHSPSRAVSSLAGGSPNDATGMGFGPSEPMSIELLRKKAFSLCQGSFRIPATPDIPIIDPPTDGKPESVGLVYQEELAVLTDLALDKTSDKSRTYFIARPRLAGNKFPMDVFVRNGANPYDGASPYQRINWEDINLRFPSDIIKPTIDPNDVPPAGRVMSEFVIGHGTPARGFPELFNLRSNGYVRFAAYPPQVVGASLRLAAHSIFSQGPVGGAPIPEEYPIVRAIFMSLNDDRDSSKALILVESQMFCGALNVDLSLVDDRPNPTPPANNDDRSHADLTIDGFWYTREDFSWKKDPNAAFVAFSSMVWKTKKHTDAAGDDQAHDSDTLLIKYANRRELERYELDPPQDGLSVHDFTAKNLKLRPVEWTLANEDRDPRHYAHFQDNLGATNYNFRDSYRVTILDSNIATGVTMFENATQFEYADNVVAASTIRSDIKKATSADDFVHFKYRTTAFFPPHHQ